MRHSICARSLYLGFAWDAGNPPVRVAGEGAKRCSGRAKSKAPREQDHPVIKAEPFGILEDICRRQAEAGNAAEQAGEVAREYFERSEQFLRQRELRVQGHADREAELVAIKKESSVNIRSMRVAK
eukprot:2653154-Pyramimonas_sp.AAC.1